MKLKRLLSLLLILCMMVTLVACGSKTSRDDDEDEDEKTVSSSKDKGNLFSKGSDAKAKNKTDDDDDDVDSIGGLFGGNSDYDYDDEDDSDIEDWSDPGDTDEDPPLYEDYSDPYATYQSVDMPQGYPSRYVPVYEDGTVFYALKDRDSDGVLFFYVMQACYDSAEDVNKFYTRELKGAEGLNTQAILGSYYMDGEFDDYRFSIYIAPDSNYKDKCIVSLEVREKD